VIFRSRHRRNFTLVDNAAIRDPRLSLRATGLLAFLLSYPDDTSFSREAIRRMKPDGVRGIRSALLELGQAGYLVHEYERDRWGHWRTHTFVYETPQGDGEAFKVPDENGARCANGVGTTLARIAPERRGKNGAQVAKNPSSNWRVSDGAKRATNYIKTEYQDAAPPPDPQRVGVAANGTGRPELGVIPDAPAIEFVADLRRHLGERMRPVVDTELQQELL